MDLLAHFMFGLWLYQKTGNIWAIPLSMIFDIDHILGYIWDRKKRFPKKTSFLLEMAYRPRTWFHSLSLMFLMVVFFSFYAPIQIVFICLAVHLLIDAMDKGGVYLLPPFSKKKISGPLPISYIWDNPVKPTHNKKGHIPSVIFIILVSLLIFLGY